MEYFAIDGRQMNGVVLPMPAFKGVTFSVQDIDSSETGRNQNGDMIRERITTKLKWQFTFPPLNRKMMAALLNALTGSSFDFTYPDPFLATGTSTKKCYVGDRTTPIYSMVDGVPMWQNVSFSIIEL